MRKWISGIVVVILALACATPYLFSVWPFKKIVERQVERKVDGKVTIDRVHFSWLGPQRMEGIHISTPQIEGDIQDVSSNVPFWAIGSFTKGIEQISGSGTTKTDGEEGRFSIDATRVLPDEVTLQFLATQMPTKATLQLLKIDLPLDLIIGPNFNAKGSASVKNNAGQFDLDFSSPKTQGSIKAQFTPGEVTLRAPMTLACYLTPELTQFLTNGALLVQSKAPARLRIDVDDFSFPRPYSLAKFRIGQANLDLSRIILQHANLAPLAALLKADSLTASQIDMWLTNVDCSLEKGVFSMGRVDALLADSIHLCAWGKANLVKSELNMIFGIPADTLAKSLRIKNLSSSYVLQIPVTGSFQKPEIDAASATAKIAILVAGQQVQKKGGVFGGVATVLGKASEEKSPPPKRPFPWE